MLMNERKSSYYDEYQRKKETNRSLVTPPTLLTDRGAYVNFLEVQLERVSAACLAVQSYDDRFTDMQNLIIALENRCATTTRLTSLAQQCSEEIRAESYTITNRLTQELNSEQRKSTEFFESLSSRLHSAELRLQSVSSLESRLLMLESKYHALEDAKILAEKEHMNEILQMKSRVDTVLAENHQLRSEIDHTNTLVSQQIFDAKEETNKVKNLLNQLEDRFEGRMAAITEDCQAKLHAMQCKHNNYVDSLNYSFAQRELELNSLHSKQYGKVGCDLTELNQLVGKELREFKNALQSSEQRQSEWSESLSDLRSDVNKQQSQLFQLEDKFIARLESLLSRYRFPESVGAAASSGNSSSSSSSGRNDKTERRSSGTSRSLLDPQQCDLSEIHLSGSGSDSDEALKSSGDAKNKSSDGEVSAESELQALLRSILNTTTANNTALNALAAVSSGSGSNTAASTAVKSGRINLSALDTSVNLNSSRSSSTAGGEPSTSESPRVSLRSRSLSPQRLLSSPKGGNAGAAVSVDATRQRSHDSLRAMGVPPSRVMGPPPFLDSASVLRLSSNRSSSVKAGTVSPQRMGPAAGGGGRNNSRSNSATSTRSEGGGGVKSSQKKSGKKGNKRRSHSEAEDDNDAAVAELARALSFSLTSPTRRQNRSSTVTPTAITDVGLNPALSHHHTVSSLERIRQSAEHRLQSPQRLSSGTAALLVAAARPEQLEALRVKGIFFRSAPQEYLSKQLHSQSGLELWPQQQLQPAWKPINTYVPPASYTQFDNKPAASIVAGSANDDAKCGVVGVTDFTSNNIITKVHSAAVERRNFVNTVAGESLIQSVSESKGSDEGIQKSGESAACGVSTSSSNSSAAMINAVKASMRRSEGTQTPTATTASVAVGEESGSRSDSRNRSVQTEPNSAVNTSEIASERVPVNGSSSSSSSRSNGGSRPTRAISNVRSAAAQRLDADAHVAFYRPASPLSHSRLSKILEQYPLPMANNANH